MAYISFQPSDFFKTVLYTGNGSTQSITGVGFQPAMNWMKGRDTTENHEIADINRGATKYIAPNSAGTEGTDANAITSFDSDGVSIGSWATYNNNTSKFVMWNWKGGTTSGITTDGSTTITPTSYSFSADAGISILKYTGNTTSGAGLAHGMGKTPAFFVAKDLSTGESWTVYHKSLGNTKFMSMNGSGSVSTATNRWNDTDPTSVNMILGNETSVNNTNMIGYCFAEVKGFSSIGSYTGNGQSFGPFIPCGFRPAFVVIKRIDGADNWVMFDDKRDGYNVDNNILYPNLTNAEATSDYLDLTSNGFTLRWSDSKANYDGGSYLYLAFAEFPFVSSNSKAGVAR
tara:strand:+ start:737 stop:1768 length:1032 start_codon:yes stop_codon:yes gene_type:complete